MIARVNLIALMVFVLLSAACGKNEGDGNSDVSVSNSLKNETENSRIDNAKPTEEEVAFAREIEKGRNSEHLSGLPRIVGADQDGSYEKKGVKSKNERSKVIELYAADLGGVDLSFIGNIELCGNGECYGVDLSSKNNGLKTNEDGTATLIGRAALPDVSGSRDLDEMRVLQIDEVKLQSKTRRGNDGAWQSLNLSRPIRLFGPMPGARVLVGISGKASCQDDGCLVLDSVDSVLTPMHSEGQYLFYNPKMAVDKELPSGVHVYLPRGMTDGVQIIVTNVMSSPNVRKYPTVTFSIHDNVKRPAVVTVRGIEGKVKKADVPDDGKGFSVQVYGPGKVVDGKFEASQVVKEKSEGRVLRKDTDPMAICLNSISSPDRQAAISSELEQTGFSILTDCVSVPPYVHMVLVEGGRGDMKFDVAFRSDPDSRHGNKIVLSQVNGFPGFKVIVNGFTWAGDMGDIRGGFGFAKGYAMGFDVSGRLERTVLGSNLLSGGSVSFCQRGDYFRICETSAVPDTPKRTLGILGDFRSMWWQTNSDVIENWYNTRSVISSSTSIISEGGCTSDGNVDRWTAFGSRPSGRSLFVSSTNTGKTSAVDLCRVFQVFGINNAIRLDGGTAASMAIDGVLMNDFNELDNPIEWLVFGSSRRVAYGFGVGINGVVGTQ